MAHSIVVDLMMRTGSFETDTKRAERALARMQKEAAAAGKVFGAALAGGAIAAAYAFDSLVKSAADFQDLSDMTGAQAEDLASLAVAAGTAGIGMDALAGHAVRLTQGLSAVDDASKPVGAAIKALGLDLQGFKKLDPVAQIDALSEAFAGFADGSEKAAVATALWGKSGAEMLKLFKVLEDQGGRTKILTQEQIEAADAYADAQARAGAELKLYAQAAATQGLPAFNAMTEAASGFVKGLFDVEEATGKLRESTALKDFAVGAAKAFAFVIDAGDGVVRVIKGIAFAAAALMQMKDLPLFGGFAEAKQIVSNLGTELDALAQRKFFSQHLEETLARSVGTPSSKSPDKPRLRFDGAASATGNAGKAAADATRQAQAYIDNLKRQLQGTQDLTVVEQVRADLQDKRFAAATAQQRAELLSLAAQIDAEKAWQEEKNRTIELFRAQAEETERLKDQATALTRSVETPIETLNRELQELGETARTNPFLSGEIQSRLEAKSWQKFADSAKESISEVDLFGRKLAENVQDILGAGLYDALSGNFKNIGVAFADMLLKMLVQAQAANLARAIFGTDSKGNLSGGWINQVGGLIGGWLGMPSAAAPAAVGGTGLQISGFPGRAAGGPVAAGQAYMVGEHGPELFRPHAAGRVLPNDLLRPSGPPKVEVINNLGVRAEPDVQHGPDGALRIMLNAVAEDTRRGGVTARATAGRFGVNNGATLNRRRG